MNLLLIIDLQNEFINNNTKNAINDIQKLINSKKFDNILFTRFINNKNNPTYNKLNWKGCLDEESRNICIDTDKYDVMDKETYTAYNDSLKKYLKDNNIENIYLCGIDIECCVLITALNLFENNYNVFVLKDYVYSVNGESRKNNALEILKRNIGNNSIL